MKHLVYLKLEDSPTLEIVGSFQIGSDTVIIYDVPQGTILFTYPFQDKLNILEADAEFLKETKSKKLPHTVVSYVEEFPTGGWSL
jgi:hypothetical protein